MSGPRRPRTERRTAKGWAWDWPGPLPGPRRGRWGRAFAELGDGALRDRAACRGERAALDNRSGAVEGPSRPRLTQSLVGTGAVPQAEAEDDQLLEAKPSPGLGGPRPWAGGQSLLNTQARSADTQRATHALRVGRSRRNAGKKPREGQAMRRHSEVQHSLRKGGSPASARAVGSVQCPSDALLLRDELKDSYACI